MGGLIPGVDPIPLPAPVWLFKVLELLVLTLHFCAVHLLLGGMAITTIWALAAVLRKDAVLIDARGAVTTRLPIVIAFLVNLGIPPLLFTQVLYGRALYTSSVLIGAFWIAVVFILMFAYHLLYRIARTPSATGLGLWLGIVAYTAFITIAFLFSSNMTLMLRPEVWLEMYRANPRGTHLPTGDPTLYARWLYMVVGSIGVGGIGLALLGMKRSLAPEVCTFLQRWGGRLAAVFALVQAGLGYWVFSMQSELVRTGLMNSTVYKAVLVAWAATLLLVVLMGATASFGKSPMRALPIMLAAVSVANIASMVVIRDGIRDLTFAAKEFDVWQRTVVVNWSTVGLFLFLLVLAIGFIGWMIWVLTKMKGAEERYA